MNHLNLILRRLTLPLCAIAFGGAMAWSLGGDGDGAPAALPAVPHEAPERVYNYRLTMPQRDCIDIPHYGMEGLGGHHCCMMAY